MRSITRSFLVGAFTAMGVLGLAACADDTVAQAPPPPAVDPCQAESYNAVACQQAITARGYYWYGVWHPVIYPYPFTYYAGGYRTYIVAHPGYVPRVSSTYYSRTYVRSSTVTRSGGAFRSGGGTVRGGFGGTGAARSASFGGGSFGG